MAGTVVTHVIIFIAVLSIATGLMLAIKNYADETQGNVNTVAQQHNQFILTSIKIDVVHYDNLTNITHVYVRNTGKTSLEVGDVNVYLDGSILAANMSNRSVVSDTEQYNTGIWDPKEVLHILADRDLNRSLEHEVVVITGNSYRVSDTFSI